MAARGATGLLDDLDVRAVGQDAHRVEELDVLGAHEEPVRVTAQPAAEAVPQLCRGVDLERGGLLGVEGTAAPEEAALLLEHDALGNERDEVGRVANASHVFVGYATHATPFPVALSSVEQATARAAPVRRGVARFYPKANGALAAVLNRPTERAMPQTSHFRGTNSRSNSRIAKRSVMPAT